VTHPISLLKVVTLAAVVGLSLISLAASAQPHFVADSLQVPLRSGMGSQYRIVHRGLSSGTKLELIKRDSDDSGTTWALVRTRSGLEGWMRNQYLLDEPTAAIKLAALEQKMSQLGGDQTALLDTNEALEADNAKLQQNLEKLQQQHQKTSRQLAELRKLSANTIALNEQHQKLSENYQLLQTRADVLKANNERLKNNQRYREWLFGAGILILGIILSFMLQAIGRNKRRSEWG
jgi:SH3 domain protein